MEGHQDYILERADFEAFCLMTQTCDLVRTREEEFITLAVVRVITNIFDKPGAKKDSTANKLKSIIQHRANTRFFYLYKEPDAGIERDSVVDLRVMFALHKKHYDEIVAARKMSMNGLYAAHLGWMAGNVFSRIAMPEWDDIRKDYTELETLDQKIKSLQTDIGEKGQSPESLEKPSARLKGRG
jgi:hypothetical protein